MFGFICVAAGALVGCAVCAFGMWAFLEGQRTMICVKSGGLPNHLFSSSKPEDVEDVQSSRPDISEQLHALFGSERSEKE
jgi:hypothetical protein